jgi:Tol biopolymer transport system component
MGLRPEQHDCLVTVPGRGYRFVARVVELDELPPGLPTSVASEHGHIADDEILPALPDAPDAVISKDEPHEQIIGPVLARSISRWPSRSVWVAWAIVAAIATATTLGVGSARQRSDESSGRSLRQVTFGAGSQQEPTWSPDGRSLAYTSDRLGDFDIWVQPLSDAAPTRLTSSPERDWQPDWSPDGKWVAFRSERDGGGIYVVPSDGGEARRITTLGFRPRWSPDGTKIMFVSSVLPVSASPRVFVVGLDGQAPALVRPDLTRDLRLLDAGWHPDGRISFWGQHGAGGRVFSTASLIGTDEAKSRVAPEIEQLVKNAGIALERFAWSPKGRYLYFEGRSNGVRNLWRVSVEPETLTWTKGLDRLTTGAGSDTELALSRDGTKVAFTVLSERTRVWSFPFDAVAGTLTGAAGPVSADGVDEQGPAIGFDGKKLVYRASLGNRHEVREYSVPDGRERVLVGGKDGARTNMHWSPDGTRLAYDVRDSSTGARTRTTAILDSDGRERILQTPSDVTWATFGWSPEGQSLLGSCRQGGTGRLAVCLLPISSTPHDPAVRVITADPDRNLFQAQFSPNGQWVMFLAIPPSGGGASLPRPYENSRNVD